MPGSRKMILKHVMSGICTKMNRTKQVPSDVMETPLNRCLNTFDITLLGVGHMIGAGIYVLTGTVAKDIAGPGIILSFLLAGLACLLSALCYAEFGTRVPKAGSAYVYTYISVGEFWAFVIGWNIILEHMIGAASVARAWSGYLDGLLGGVVSNATASITGPLHPHLLSAHPDFLALVITLIHALLLAIGVKTSAVFNSILTLLNLGVLALVVIVGFYYGDEGNWTKGGGFLPFGFGGVIAGAATCFYAFVGFDCIATSGEEAKNPSFSIPMATVVSMGVVTLAYILVSAVLTLMVPYYEIHATAAIPEAFSHVGMHWVKHVVSVGALCGMTTTLFGSLFSLPRCMYAMATDGLLFGFMGQVNKKTQLPLVNLALSAVASGVIALLFDLETLVEFMSIGTLLAYTIVGASVIILRYRPDVITSESSVPTPEMGVAPSAPHNIPGSLRVECYGWLVPVLGGFQPGSAVTFAVVTYTVVSSALCVLLQLTFSGAKHCYWLKGDDGIWWAVIVTVFLISILVVSLLVIVAHHQNPIGPRFKVPLVPFIPALSILCNIEFMVHLNILTWLRFFVWMVVGMLVYFLYGIHNSKEGEGNPSSYSLMTSPEAVKEKWGATTTKANVNLIKGALTHRKAPNRGEGGDRQAIIEDDDSD